MLSSTLMGDGEKSLGGGVHDLLLQINSRRSHNDQKLQMTAAMEMYHVVAAVK